MIPRLRPGDHFVGALLAGGYVLLLLVASHDVAMSRDEGFYVDAANSYAGWLRLVGAPFRCDAGACRIACTEGEACRTGAPCVDGRCAAPVAMSCTTASECGVHRRELVDRFWAPNHEHPSLPKTMFALFHLADERYELFSAPSVGYRFFGMLTGGLLLWLIYVFGAQTYGRSAGLFASLAFALMPRIFYHSQLDAFDVPIALMTTLVTYAYCRAIGDWRWLPILGLCYGLALATKHNAWILPLIFLIHMAFVAATERRHRRFGGAPRVALTPYWLLAMLLIGPIVFVALWPWLWHDTLQRFGEYAGFHFGHTHYNMAYFGVNYFRAPVPMSYPWVMTVLTVSAVTLVLALIGIGARARALLPFGLEERWWPNGSVRPDPRRTDVLFLGCLLPPLVVISMPWTPIFGGTKHWFPAYPFLALFAGAGFVAVLRHALPARRGLPTAVRGWAATVGLGALFLAPAAAETAHSHPFGLSHYTYAAGGVPGAADLGMNRQFWGFTTGSLADWLNRKLPDGGTVWICDMTPRAWAMMQADGRLSRRIRSTASLVSAALALVHHEDHFAEVDFQIWEAFGTVRPVEVLTYDGVPIISVYENPRRRQR
ncbi:MAG: ArnT family glycosyltransferase [Sandaracinaceae bacterium]